MHVVISEAARHARSLAVLAGLIALALPAPASAQPRASQTVVKPRVSPCAPVAVQTFHGKRLEARCRLALIEHGHVPCLHPYTGKVVSCTFTPRSGEWLESKSGEIFAVAGSQIARDGRRGGSYTVVSKRWRNGRPPCAEPGGRGLIATAADSAGTAVGTEGVEFRVQETAGSPSNALGRPLANYTTGQVCGSSSPHPDAAALVSTPAPGVYCYSGRGAGLNNSQGQEHDASGSPQGLPAHFIWNGTYELPAAKRPQFTTRRPVHVMTNTPIVWRAYVAAPGLEW